MPREQIADDARRPGAQAAGGQLKQLRLGVRSLEFDETDKELLGKGRLGIDALCREDQPVLFVRQIVREEGLWMLSGVPLARSDGARHKRH
jgi:hypothetical protein